MEQRTEEWYEVRLGKVGASEIAKIIKKRKMVVLTNKRKIC